MTTLEIAYLLAGLWLGMGFTCWVVPTWASLHREPPSVMDALVLVVVLVLGPAAVVFYARHERERS